VKVQENPAKEGEQMENSASQRAKCDLRTTTRWAYGLLIFAMLAAIAYGQSDRVYPKPQPDKHAPAADPGNVPEAIARVKSGDFFAVDVEMIAEFHAVEAVPVLEAQFARTQDPQPGQIAPLDKEHIASGLVRLGDQDPAYWDFLMKSATAAVESDVSDPFLYDAQGKASSANSAELATWAKALNFSLTDAGQEALFRTIAVSYLAMTGDPRATPLLRQALLARNFMIANQAALGLAMIGDKDSIPLIIEACKRAPAEGAAEIALSLVYFDDSQAQNAVDKYIPADRAKIYREARAAGKTPFQ
jgi:hypothetical protein